MSWLRKKMDLHITEGTIRSGHFCQILQFYMVKYNLKIEGKLNRILVKKNLNAQINSVRTEKEVTSLREQERYCKH